MVNKNDEPVGQIHEGDVVIAFNFRTDRLRQMTHVLTQENMPDFGMKTLPLHYYTMTRYDDKFRASMSFTTKRMYITALESISPAKD